MKYSWVPAWADSIPLCAAALGEAGTLFPDPRACLSQMLGNGPLSLPGQSFHVLQFNLLFQINTGFRWHLLWQIFGQQPGMGDGGQWRSFLLAPRHSW